MGTKPWTCSTTLAADKQTVGRTDREVHRQIRKRFNLLKELSHYTGARVKIVCSIQTADKHTDGQIDGRQTHRRTDRRQTNTQTDR